MQEPISAWQRQIQPIQATGASRSTAVPYQATAATWYPHPKSDQAQTRTCSRGNQPRRRSERDYLGVMSRHRKSDTDCVRCHIIGKNGIRTQGGTPPRLKLFLGKISCYDRETKQRQGVHTEQTKMGSRVGYLEVGVAATKGDGGRPSRCMKDDRICSGLRNNRAWSHDGGTKKKR